MGKNKLMEPRLKIKQAMFNNCYAIKWTNRKTACRFRQIYGAAVFQMCLMVIRREIKRSKASLNWLRHVPLTEQ